jgi:hypothetical protein
MDGVTTIVKVAHVCLCHSRMMFVRAYPAQALLAPAIADLPQAEAPLVLSAGRWPSGAEVTCPVTTRRLLRDIAAAAVKAWESGDHGVTPFWRVVDPEMPTARLMAGGTAFIRARRAEEAV